MKTNFHFLLINPSLWFDTLVFYLPPSIVLKISIYRRVKRTPTYIMPLILLYWVSTYLIVYLILDTFQSKVQISVPLVPKHSGMFLPYFKFFMTF